MDSNDTVLVVVGGVPDYLADMAALEEGMDSDASAGAPTYRQAQIRKRRLEAANSDSDSDSDAPLPELSDSESDSSTPPSKGQHKVVFERVTTKDAPKTLLKGKGKAKAKGEKKTSQKEKGKQKAAPKANEKQKAAPKGEKAKLKQRSSQKVNASARVDLPVLEPLQYRKRKRSVDDEGMKEGPSVAGPSGHSGKLPEIADSPAAVDPQILAIVMGALRAAGFVAPQTGMVANEGGPSKDRAE